eukprot:131242-Pleurochrysis_carterae.AAC.3
MDGFARLQMRSDDACKEEVEVSPSRAFANALHARSTSSLKIAMTAQIPAIPVASYISGKMPQGHTAGT